MKSFLPIEDIRGLTKSPPIRVVIRGVSSSTTAFAGSVAIRLGAKIVAILPAAAWIASRRDISTENPDTAPMETHAREMIFKRRIMFVLSFCCVICQALLQNYACTTTCLQ